jgi:hypothetical protein
MYCPLCGAEYRANVTTCADCQVALAPDPPDQQSKNASPMDSSFVQVWSGSDQRKCAEVCESLDREKIPARTLRREDFLIVPTSHSDFEVYVPAAMKAKAKTVLKDSMITEEDDEQAVDSDALEIPAEDDYESREENTRRQPDEWDPQDATVKLWAGQDADVAQMITASLRENRILYRTNADDADPASEPAETAIEVFTIPEDEARGKEIVREIVDAAPPESETK